MVAQYPQHKVGIKSSLFHHPIIFIHSSDHPIILILAHSKKKPNIASSKSADDQHSCVGTDCLRLPWWVGGGNFDHPCDACEYLHLHRHRHYDHPPVCMYCGHWFPFIQLDRERSSVFDDQMTYEGLKDCISRNSRTPRRRDGLLIRWIIISLPQCEPNKASALAIHSGEGRNADSPPKSLRLRTFQTKSLFPISGNRKLGWKSCSQIPLNSPEWLQAESQGKGVSAVNSEKSAIMYQGIQASLGEQWGDRKV